MAEVQTPWIETATGGQFSFSNPMPDQIEIVDIAAALAKQCRFNGHCSHFYSVAEHCVHMTRYAEANGASLADLLHILLHDATEAYIGDMVKPLKIMMPEFSALEDRIWTVIVNRFSIDTSNHKSVKVLDLRMLAREREIIMPHGKMDWDHDGKIEALPIQIYAWDPGTAAAEFLRIFQSIQNAMGLSE